MIDGSKNQMNNIISTFEIAVIIILPLIIIYRRNNINIRIYIKNIVLIYLIWYFTYAPLHEISHLTGVWALGLKIKDYQLIPKFWKGDLGTAYISTYYQNSLQEFITDVMPYLRDLIFLIIGYIILKKIKFSGVFIFGLIVVLLILSPFYDVFNNYFAFVLGSLNDFNGMRHYAGNFGAHAIGISITVLGLISACWILFSKKFVNAYLDFKQK